MAKALGAVLLLLSLAGCVTVQVSADWDPSADFTKFRSWQWLDIARPATGNPRLDDPLLHRRIQQAIARGLAAQGYPQATEQEPDFWVVYHLALEQRLDARTIYHGYGPYRGWYGGAETVVDQYEVGFLLVDFISPATQTVVWRGKAQSRVNETRDPTERETRVRDAVTKLLAQFPPTAK